MPSGTIDSGKYIPSTPSDAGVSIFGKIGNWINNNKAEILQGAADVGDIIGEATGNNKWNVAAGVTRAAGQTLGQIDDKNSQEKLLAQLIQDRNARMFGNKHIAYADVPRMFYGRKPTRYKMYQRRNKYIDEANEKLNQLKKQIEQKQKEATTENKKPLPKATSHSESPKKSPPKKSPPKALPKKQESPPKKKMSAAEKARNWKQDKQFVADLQEAVRRQREAYDKFEKDDW